MQLEDIDLTAWIGRTETATDIVTPTPVRALSATLDHPVAPAPAGTPLPPLWHWLYFLPVHAQSELGPDGHARRGGFLPPVELPRRMWAGGRFEFRAPIRVGDPVVRTSTIENVTSKVGRTGPLVFVTVPDEVEPAPTPARTGALWQRRIVPDDVLLFRYSALTFNGHRIHYDRRYVTEVEGYPGLIVHGPLIATLLLDLLRRHMPEAVVLTYRFKAVRPLFDLHPFTVCGRPDGDKRFALWARSAEGALAMQATAEIA